MIILLIKEVVIDVRAVSMLHIIVLEVVSLSKQLPEASERRSNYC
jgi:hypothetical protein